MESIGKIFENIVKNDNTNQYTSERMLSETYKNNIFPNIFLDLGCGNGNFRNYIHNNFINTKYIGIDIYDSPEVNSRTDDHDIISYDGIHIPFDENSIDCVYANQVLEHVEFPNDLLPEISRVLTKDGFFIGSVSQLEPYHSYSLFNYTFYGLYKIFIKSKLQLVELRHGCDSLSIINRTIDKFYLKNKLSIGDSFWVNESPLNYIIQNVFRSRSIKNINFLKIKLAGQIIFKAKKLL